jgi:hypothetical protein
MFFLITLLSPAPGTAAYLDPGSGSFLIQLLIGGVVALVLLIKGFWGRIKLFFNNLLGRETAVDPEMEQTESHDDNA